MKKLHLLIAALIIITTFASCNWFTSPEELKPGRRDYVWKNDTLKVPRSYLHRLWGSSPNDVWAICQAGDYDKTLWHYDGEAWSADSVNRHINPWSIYGFAPNNIWVGGLEGRIWHYDGNVWEEDLNLEPKSKWVYSGFNDIWGTSPNDVYAIGFLDSIEVRYSIIYHYDEYEWKRQNISPEPGVNFLRIKKGVGDPNYYIQAWKTNPLEPDTTLIIGYNNNKLETLYRGLLNNQEAAYAQLLGDNIYFTINNGICTYDGSFHQRITINTHDWGRAFYGRNEKDVFLAMESGIAHHNGNDIEYIYPYSTKIILKDALIFKNEIFMILSDYDNNYDIIKRGILE